MNSAAIAVRSVLTASACVLFTIATSTGVAAQPFDHLTCFKAKDTQVFKGLVTLDALQDQFDPSGQCEIKGLEHQRSPRPSSHHVDTRTFTKKCV